MMDITLVIFLLLLAIPVIWLPLLGKKWSTILSYLVFGSLLALGLVVGYLLFSEPPAGESHAWGGVYLLIAAFAAVMMLLTYFVYRYRQRKAGAA